MGGDAYNCTIGASLVGGRMSGFIKGKAVAVVTGAICDVRRHPGMLLLEHGRRIWYNSGKTAIIHQNTGRVPG